MKTKLLTLLTALSLLLVALPIATASAQDVPDPNEVLKPRSCAAAAQGPVGVCAGYGEADNTWHVGAGAGQYAGKAPQEPLEGAAGEDIDPHNHSLVQENSYGVQSRLSFRAIVVEDAQGDQTAFVKSDNYLAQDALLRRVGQILTASRSNITYDEIMHMASHNHFSPYYSTPSWGVWLFQDVLDLRAFEYQAKQMAQAILDAEDALEPAQMGATTIEHRLFKGMVARRGIADDGTPVGYPLDFGDFGLSVVRFDSLDGDPIGTLVNWGMHPEGLKHDRLITAEFVAPLERFVERATRLPGQDRGTGVVFGQGDVGSAESGPARPYDEEWPEGVPQQWDDAGHAQVERGAYLLAQDVIEAYKNIGSGTPSAPPYEKNFVGFTHNFDVAAGNAFIPGPYSHPVPSVSNCRSEPTVKGDNGVPITGLPDCDRTGPVEDLTGEEGYEYPDTPEPVARELGALWDNMQAHGIPVPAHYAAPGFTGVEENLRLKLQAFKLGEVILMSCACEAQVDLILNLETRVDEEQGNMWLGYDWTKRLDCTQANPPHGPWECVRDEDPNDEDPADPNKSPRATFPGKLTFSDAAYERMLAQIYNDAGKNGGWDAPRNSAHAETDPNDTTAIWGNFTHEELSADLGYKVPIGVGHGGDYNGYTVSYREYMAYDHYRKALTSYGPHTADYMNNELMEMASELNGGPDVVGRAAADADDLNSAGAEGAVREVEEEAGDTARGGADEARQVSWTTALGVSSAAAYAGWTNTLPDDLGPAEALTQPKDITRFDAATFSWRGGSNAVDNPIVTVERCPEPGTCTEPEHWVTFADQSGEIQTMLDFPNGVEGALGAYRGEHEWKWTANFEAFNAYPAGIGSTPEGEYRFRVRGTIRQSSMNENYDFPSESFTVSSWDGLKVGELAQDSNGHVSFEIDSRYPETYPATHQPEFPYVTRHMRGEADRGELLDEDIDVWCDTCSFRPWATQGIIDPTKATAEVTVVRADGSTETVSASFSQTDKRWHADTALYEGDRAYVAPGAVVDNYGETNSAPSAELIGTRKRDTVTPTPTESETGTPTETPSETPTEDPVSTSELVFTDRSAEAGQYTDEALIEARLTGNDGPLAGEEIAFELVGADGSSAWTATTNGDGIAGENVLLTRNPGSYQLIARFAGSGDQPATATTTAFVIERDEPILKLTAKRKTATGTVTVVSLTAVLTDDDRKGLRNRALEFSADGQVFATKQTNRDGRATADVPKRFRQAESFSVGFGGSDFLTPASAHVER